MSRDSYLTLARQIMVCCFHFLLHAFPSTDSVLPVYFKFVTAANTTKCGMKNHYTNDEIGMQRTQTCIVAKIGHLQMQYQSLARLRIGVAIPPIHPYIFMVFTNLQLLLPPNILVKRVKIVRIADQEQEYNTDGISYIG